MHRELTATPNTRHIHHNTYTAPYIHQSSTQTQHTTIHTPEATQTPYTRTRTHKVTRTQQDSTHGHNKKAHMHTTRQRTRTQQDSAHAHNKTAHTHTTRQHTRASHVVSTPATLDDATPVDTQAT
ncbi:hypothetical protein E2C01_052092 [Portunus trituberculatus]|uniref:Uncharacterized protein n=1 Tax=Portunus trituberculatus TaxID=210409 RepID=A0A5B7GLF3_PORTR|nr:hypothetical protein [Portunus trituberculatus]